MLLFKFSLGSFGAFLKLDDYVSRKRLVVEQNGPKVGPHGYVYSVYRVILSLKCSSLVENRENPKCSNDLTLILNSLQLKVPDIE